MPVSRELPKYKSYKEVWALKIKSIVYNQRLLNGYPLSATLTPEDEGYAPFEVDAEYVRKHEPKGSGYFVQYKDGYKSWSPAEAFETGYIRIE